MKTIIYCIFDENEMPIYIGKTIQKINVRKNHHRHRFGHDISVIELDYVDDWKFWEKYWIEQFKVWGYDLRNRNSGGGGPTKHSEETKQLMSQQRKGTLFSDAHKNKLSISAKQKVFTNEHKANIGKTSLGRTKSDEVKKRISQKLKGIKRKPMSDEVKEKIRQKLLLKNKK
jgi:hypothetical protein